jgi:hypothetical protein
MYSSRKSLKLKPKTKRESQHLFGEEHINKPERKPAPIVLFINKYALAKSHNTPISM